MFSVDGTTQIRRGRGGGKEPLTTKGWEEGQIFSSKCRRGPFVMEMPRGGKGKTDHLCAGGGKRRKMNAGRQNTLGRS